MLVASIVVEFVTPVCIVAGWHDRLAAFILAGFCVITAVLFHQKSYPRVAMMQP
jgi:putative oxidoreductase